MVKTRLPSLLSIAGSDPSGGAGIQADMKTFTCHRCYGMGVITALTVQNTQGVQAIYPVEPRIFREQLIAILSNMRVDGIKIGMLATLENVIEVAHCLEAYPQIPVVLDPVMTPSFWGNGVGGGGGHGAAAALMAAMRMHLLSHVDLLTPNIPEALALLAPRTIAPPQTSTEMEVLANILCDLGPKAVLLKGGHMDVPGITQDCLMESGVRESHFFVSPRVATPHTHGTGCALSAAILACQGQGDSLHEAVKKAKAYIQGGLESRQHLPFADQETYGPFNHLWQCAPTEVNIPSKIP